MKLMPHNPKHFGKNAPMIKVITKVLIDSYISERAFGPLRIVELKDGIYLKNETDLSNKWGSKEVFSDLYL